MGEGGSNMMGAGARPRRSKVNKIEQVPCGHMVAPPHEQIDMSENITFLQSMHVDGNTVIP